ncbi:MAG: ATP-dependent helicase UvrD/PcrA [Actinomycetota bacterium]|nr:ATP-dependent helicase UvrD/PcrA [Actinomycetota bacterium]
MAAVAELPDAGVITRLGRGVIVGPGSAAPDHWAGADRVVVDAAALQDPAEALDALHRHWSQRTPVVVELRCTADELRAPETEPDRPPWALSPRFEFGRERLYFLARANNYDDRVGRMVWGPTVEAQRLGATVSDVADVVLPAGTPAWCDGGPRSGTTPVPEGHRLIHRNNLEQRHLAADLSVATDAELAADQLAAVVHDTGAARVIAPAGSGKTRVLTERFRLLVDRGWSPGSITAVAYNVRAKDTMRSRLSDMPEAATRRVRTLHALGNDVLRRAGGNTSLIDEWEMRRRIEALVPVKPRANTDMYAPYLEALSEVRLGLVDPNVIEAQRDDVAGFGAMFDEYRDKLQADRAIDHDEQIYGAIEALLRAPDVRRAFQREARHLLVDEFQDLTPAQLLLLRLIAAPAYDVFGVGDDDQVIYGYAGADPEFLINYDRYFPGGTHHALATNYRCPAPVVAATRNLLSYNRRRIDKEIVAAKAEAATEPTDALTVVAAAPERIAHAAVERVSAWLATGARPEQIAVLSRVNSALLPAQLLLGEAGVASWTPVSVAVLHRTGTRTALAYLRLALAAGNNSAFHGADLALAARRPSRSLRREVLQRLERKREWRLTALRREGDAMNATAAVKFDVFCDDLDGLGQAFDGGATTDQLLTRIRDEVGLGAALATLDQSGKTPDASHRDDLNALIAVATFEPDPAAFEPWLRARLRAANERARDDGVALSTVHRVKGMEWPYVVVLGAHDGLMPHALADDIEEERRIFHVAITRGDTAVHVVADATARRPFLDELIEAAPPEPVRPTRAATEPLSSDRTDAPGRGRNTVDAELGLRVTFAGSTGPLVELRIDGAVLEEAGGTRVVIPYGERVELDGRRAQLVRGRAADVTHASPQLVDALKAWRRQRAASDGVPAYIVLSDAHLEGIADRRPESLMELAGCTGIGPTKLERYGDEIVAVIADSPPE